MSRTVAITGANGYVGSRIVRRLGDAEFDVVGLVRAPGPGDRAFDMDQTPAPDLLQGVDTLIHCAWDMRLSSWQDIVATNVEGSLRLLQAAADAGVGQVIFISTMSAFPGCRSHYGKAKLKVEEAVMRSGGVVIRPGLIYGDEPGSLTGTLTKLAQRTPVLPMIGTGSFALYPCHEEDLADLIIECCQSSAQHGALILTAAERTPRKFRDIVGHLANKKLLIVPVPWRFVWAMLRTLEAIGIRPPFKSDSLIGLVYSDPSPDFDALERFTVRFRSLEN